MAYTAKEIITKIKNDDMNAFENLFYQYYHPLCVYANSFLGNQNVSEDIVQDIFLKIWKLRKKITFNQSGKSYLYAAVKNNALRHLQKQSTHQKHHANISVNAQKYINPNKALEYSELLAVVDVVLQQLPERAAQVFKLSRFEHKKYKEIAELLEISVKTVEADMGKALGAFRKSLEEYRTNE